jgi:PAS domain S-box-containing protein
MTNDTEGRISLPALRDTIAQWPSPVCVLTGSDHVFDAASAAYTRMVGGRDLLGRPFAEALPELARQGYVQRLDRVFQSGERVRGEGVAVRWDRDGSGTETDGVVDFVYQPLRGPDGAITGVVVEVHDVSARTLAEREREEARSDAEALALQLQEQASELEQQTEEAQALAEELEQTVEELRGNEAQFRALADSIPNLAWMADASGSILWYNQRWYDYTGTNWEQMHGWGWRVVQDPAALPRVEERYRAAIASGEPWEDTFPLRGADGRFRWFLSRALPIRDDQGRIVRWFGTNTDITEQRQGEEERQRLVAMLENSPDFIGIATADGKPVYLNPSGRELVGLASADEALRTPLDDFFDPADLAHLHGVILPKQMKEGHWQGEFRVRHFGTGELIPVEYNGFVIRHPDTGATLGVANVNRDLRARKRAEAERQSLLESAQAARAEAEAANRAKSQFLATMSHEIRTPINAIIGYVELIEVGIAGPLSPGQQEYLERVKASSRHLLGLVNDVLDLSKLDAGGMTAVAERASLASAAAEAVALVAPQAEARGIQLARAEGCDADALYVGDPDRVRQILVNLLSNAVKFTEPGGSIAVRCRTTAEDGPAAGEWAVLEVEDTGIGIAEEQLASIFDPFVQVDASHTRTRGGTGLGLAISRNLARLMGGELTACSVPGHGSTFALWLPSPESPRRAAPAGDGEAPDLLASWAFGPREVPGLAHVGHIIASNAEAITTRFGERVATDPGTPSAHDLDRAHREDHFATTTLEIGKGLTALDEGGGEPALLGDIADIQRTVAERHGRQRLRHGWSADELRRESQILWEEIQETVRREAPSPAGADVEAALDIVHRLLLRAERIALASHAAWSEAGASP